MLHRLIVVFTLTLVGIASAQLSWIRHDITRNLPAPNGLDGIDVNKDGKIDIVTASNNGVKWWRNSGNGSFSANTVGSLTGAWSVHAADVDGDGDIDMAAASPNPQAQELRLWLNNGGWSSPFIFPFLEAEDVFCADLDGSGVKEILGMSWAENLPDSGNDLTYFTNYSGTNYTRVTIDPNLSGAHSVVAADFDKDGDQDIAASGDGHIYIYRNEGGARFSTRKDIANHGSLSLTTADMDNDGDPDLVVQGRNPPNQDVFWFERTSSLNFVKRTVGNDIGECWAAHGTDIDGDGDMDVVASSQTYRTIRAYINDGSFNFTELPVVENFGTATGAPGCRGEFPMDIDKDGDMDIVGVAPGENTLAWFETVVVPTVTVTSPNGGESWVIGSAHDIAWTTAAGISNVKIELSTDGGISWQLVAANASNIGIYAWTVPNLPSSTCRIRISDSADGSPVDIGDTNFTISAPKVTLTAPNGGENWFSGTSRTIRWSSNGTIASVKLDLSRDNGNAWLSIATSTTNDGSFPWDIPPGTSATCLVRVSDVTDSTRFDVSNSKFSITDPSITAGAPDGGETLLVGSVATFSWSSVGPTDAVTIELSRDGGNLWEVLASGVANNGSYAWTVAGTRSSTCLWRISDAADHSPIDVSDSVFTIISPNRAPTADLGGPYSAPRGMGIVFDASRSADPDGDNLTYEWDFGDGTTGGAVQVTHAYSRVKAYKVTLIVGDGLGGEAQVSDSVEVFNRPPVAHAGGPYLNPDSLVVHFDAGASTDEDGDTLTFVWSFGDGTRDSSSGSLVSHTYARFGTYEVAVHVQDGLGGADADRTSATVGRNAAPLVDISANASNVAGICTDTYEVQFTLNLAEDPDGELLTFDWNFGDGSPHSNGTSSLHHVFNVPGAYQVVLKVTDDGGASTADTVQLVLAANHPPLAAFTIAHDTVAVNAEVAFDAGASSDPDGDITSYIWSWGDGGIDTTSQPNVTHVYRGTGGAFVQLTVADGCGRSATASRVLHVVLPTGVEEATPLPSEFTLAQNFPNPVTRGGPLNSQTRIGFNLPAASEVSIAIYNISGQRVVGA